MESAISVVGWKTSYSHWLRGVKAYKARHRKESLRDMRIDRVLLAAGVGLGHQLLIVSLRV